MRSRDDDAVWRALADPTRRRILDLLRARPRTTGELAAEFPTTRYAVMKHLALLEQARLVVVTRRGRERWNYLNAVPLREAPQRWLSAYADAWATGLLRLKELTEGTEHMTSTAMAIGELDLVSEVTIDASRQRVFAALTSMGEWWPHRFRSGAPVAFEPWVGGRFFEDWGEGQGALYGTVTTLDRPERLVVSGPMGMRGPVAGVITIELAERDGGTVLHLSHRGFGDIDDDTRASYRTGWDEVLDALRSYAAG